MDSEFAPKITAPPYYRLIPHMGSESAQFIIDNLLRLVGQHLEPRLVERSVAIEQHLEVPAHVAMSGCR